MMRWLTILLLLGPLLPGATLENENVSGPETAPVFAEHQPFTATITVRNPHDRAVKVDRLDASCTCMQLELGERFILPLQATTLTIRVDNANRSGPQRMGVSIYFTDPELEAVDVTAWWKVTEDVAVDAIAPLADPTVRPADLAWRDVYKFVDHERPDELGRLLKRIRISSPTPGLELAGIDYAGGVWAFVPAKQADGSWLVTASAKDPAGTLPEKTYDEKVVIRTNNPQKPAISVQMVAIIDRNAGRAAIDPLALPAMGP